MFKKWDHELGDWTMVEEMRGFTNWKMFSQKMVGPKTNAYVNYVESPTGVKLIADNLADVLTVLVGAEEYNEFLNSVWKSYAVDTMTKALDNVTYATTPYFMAYYMTQHVQYLSLFLADRRRLAVLNKETSDMTKKDLARLFKESESVYNTTESGLWHALEKYKETK